MKNCMLGSLGFLMFALSTRANADLLAYDAFEYAVERNKPGASEAFAAHGPWNGAKTYQDGRTGARGYVYTKNTIPGCTASFPGRNSMRVLCLEALGKSLQGQTDFYLQYGSASGPPNQVPANVWFQFWIYINRSDSQMSEILSGKFIYPSRDGIYPATNRSPERGNCYHWLFTLRNWSGEPFGVQGSDGRGFFSNRPPNADFTAASEYPTNKDKLGPNLGKREDFILEPNRWHLAKVHIDMSGKSPLASVGQGVYEVWMREKDQPWRKTTEWLGGKTRNFTWPLLAQANEGSKTFRMPTTADGDYWIYMDDFAMATAENDLPAYDD